MGIGNQRICDETGFLRFFEQPECLLLVRRLRYLERSPNLEANELCHSLNAIEVANDVAGQRDPSQAGGSRNRLERQEEACFKNAESYSEAQVWYECHTRHAGCQGEIHFGAGLVPSEPA